MGKQLLGGMAVKRRSRFVEDHEMERIFCDRERACHFDHLTFANRQVADDGIGSNPVVREDLVEFVTDELASPPAPAPTRDARVKDARILGNAKIGTERQLLEYAANPE